MYNKNLYLDKYTEIVENFVLINKHQINGVLIAKTFLIYILNLYIFYIYKIIMYVFINLLYLYLYNYKNSLQI